MRLFALLALSTVLVCLATASPVARAQDATPSASAPNSVDEIVVTRQRLSSMRRELERAQEDLYKLFNANNSDHQLDMYCHYEMPTGSRVSRRVCRPVFVDTATEQSAWDYTGYLLKHCANPCAPGIEMEMAMSVAQEPFGKIPFMAKRLDQEMQRLVHENPDVAKAFANYQGKERAYHEALSKK
jgi:hypothetical protein